MLLTGLHLLLSPTVREEEKFWSRQGAFTNKEKCGECGLCQEICRFDAVQDYRVDPVPCESCGFCYQICLTEAITIRESMAGHWFSSDTPCRIGVNKLKGRVISVPVCLQNMGTLAPRNEIEIWQKFPQEVI